MSAINSYLKINKQFQDSTKKEIKNLTEFYLKKPLDKEAKDVFEQELKERKTELKRLKKQRKEAIKINKQRKIMANTKKKPKAAAIKKAAKKKLSEKQKAALEKGRKKRAENIAKKSNNSKVTVSVKQEVKDKNLKKKILKSL